MEVFPGHRLAHLLPLAHLLATSQVPTLFHLGQPPLHGRPPGPPRGHPDPRLTPLLMVLQLLSLLCLNACLQKGLQGCPQRPSDTLEITEFLLGGVPFPVA